MSESALDRANQRESPGQRVREFFRVAKLIPEEQDIVAVHPDTPVREALLLMNEHGFSQVPVLAGTTVIGVFSYRSLAAGLDNVRRQDNPLDYAVDNFIEDIAYARASDEVGEILSHLDRDGAVLVGDESNLIAVATATDVVTFLWETTRPFVLLQDIELACRDLMIVACPSSDELSQRIAAAMSSDDDTHPTTLQELTMGELMSVLFNSDNYYQCFRQTFGGNRDLVFSLLEPTREIRNKVFHFRDDVTVEELDVLVSARRWLLRKVLTVRAS